MSESKVDWAVLRGSLGVFAICLLVGAVLLGASYYFREEMETEYRNHHSRFRDVSRKYLAVDEEERIIENHYPDFVRLFNRGILGQEHRLSWVETIRSAREEIQIPELTYRVNSQQRFEPDFPVDRGPFNIYSSEMDLTLGLLHEGDLFRLLEALDDKAKGLYSVKSCDAHRTLLAGEVDPKRPTLTVSCQLNWFTVDLTGDRKLSL